MYPAQHSRTHNHRKVWQSNLIFILSYITVSKCNFFVNGAKICIWWRSTGFNDLNVWGFFCLFFIPSVTVKCILLDFEMASDIWMVYPSGLSEFLCINSSPYPPTPTPIIWTNSNPIHWHIFTSLGGNELKCIRKSSAMMDLTKKVHSFCQFEIALVLYGFFNYTVIFQENVGGVPFWEDTTVVSTHWCLNKMDNILQMMF